MRGYRQAISAVLTVITLLLILGCAQECPYEKSYETRQITETVNVYGEESYIVQETKVIGQKCIEREYNEFSDSVFNVSIEDKEWVSQPPVLGETNYLRRVINVYNALDEIDTVYLDKIYLYNGSETKRSRTPMKFLVEPKSTRKLYFVWNTQYDPLKDVSAEFSESETESDSEEEVFLMCYNETEQVNVTKYRKIIAGTEEKVVGEDSAINVKLNRKC